MSIESKFASEDEFGLGTTPYYGIKLTPEQFDVVKHKKIELYQIDGRTFFAVKDKDGEFTGEMMLFVVFV